MRNTIIFGFSLLITLTFTVGCDKVETPLPEPAVLNLNDSITFPTVDSVNLNRGFKKTYVEEFTGHKCTTCPANTKLLLAQLALNKDRMIVTSVHAGSFAQVDDFGGYPTDFNTPYGTLLFQNFTTASTPIPSAIINRRSFDNFNNLMIFNNATTFWTDPINFENSNTSTDIALGVEADFIDSLNLFYIQVSAEALTDLTSTYRLLVLCVEDSIVAPQLDSEADESIYPHKIVTDYIHSHVLRGKLNSDQSIAGDPFISGTIPSGEWLDYKLNAEMPANVLNKENATIVAVIVNEITGEVIQSEETHVHVVE
ncbi:Omp28-related outer membrane protein [Salibacteraceae bacterium]|jgi:hypothetical protein|nr:Omp28-related outer membrane protein [Salibacteraceae bacterium]MDB4104110.1 Omp28-related outer membrane protein [Salibacteraceae bacterium]MDB9709148.1 Omp28-related outer membrane protein [Salibacteraceae bacterium]MDC1303920.1 Omp28-related outer membrane protein [Salibacteraceae bacterium]